MCRGATAIVGPGGDLLAGPLMEEEGILYAELDAATARRSRAEFDPVGHYSRPDRVPLERRRPGQAADRLSISPERG